MYIQMMRKILSIALCIILIFGLSSCKTPELSNDYYNDVYYEAYTEGYDDGFIDGQKELGGYADYRFDDAYSESDIEDALAILILYADGESFSEEEIFWAIQAVTIFHDEVCDIINDVEYYYED
jgi:hypothetical protein